jgi:hypothetical protein
MRELIRLYMQIALLRRGPQDLPASTLLLVITVLAYLGVSLLADAVLPSVKGESTWPEQLLIDTVFTLVWYVALLRLVGRPERTLQTVTAVFGLQALLAAPEVAFAWVMRRYIEDSTWQVPIICLGLLLLAWLIAANSYIVKVALEWSSMASVALVILQILAGQLLVLALLTPAKG